jgi:REP element-mobilizing transposase RayT
MFLASLGGMKPLAYHYAAQTRDFRRPFEKRDACVDAWKRLQLEFPKVQACVLMPDHVHLITRGAPDKGRWRFAIQLRALTRATHPGSNLWQPIPEPEPIPDFRHLLRQIRYVHLNPCRSGLASDPLEWEWSTHRDAVGAAWPGWIDLDLIREALRCPSGHTGSRLHQYVSADPTVSVTGTPAPRPPANAPVFVSSPETLIQAATTALRAPREDVRRKRLARRLTLHLGRALGHEARLELLRAVGVTKDGGIRALASPLPSGALQSALQLLADQRLLRGLK